MRRPGQPQLHTERSRGARERTTMVRRELPSRTATQLDTVARWPGMASEEPSKALKPREPCTDGGRPPGSPVTEQSVFFSL